MRLPKTDYLKSASINETVANLAESEGKAKILAGGTSILVNMKHRLSKPDLLIGIKSIPELSSFTMDEGGAFRFGASCVLDEISASSDVKNNLEILSESIKALASKHIRNVATLGGNICLDSRCWYYNQPKLWRDARELCYKTGGAICHAIKKSDCCHAINSADTSPVMVALNAVFSIIGKKGERDVKASDFYIDNGKNHIDIGSDEILTSVSIPSAGKDNVLTSFLKISSRRGIDFAYGNIAVCLKSGKGKGFEESKIVIGAMNSAPVFLEKASTIIAESGLTKTAVEEASNIASSELGTLTNLFTSAGYKRGLASSLVKKALNSLSEKAKKRGKH